MAAGKQTKSDNPKVFDVSRPGKTPADASSRPVITNRKTVEDPDVSAQKLMNPKQKITVKPAAESQSKPGPEEKKSKQESAGAPESPAAKSNEGSKIAVKSQAKEPEKIEPEKLQLSPEQSKPKPESEPEPKPEPTTTDNQHKEEEAESIGKAAIDDSMSSGGEQKAQDQPAAGDKTEPLHMDMPQEFTPADAVVSQHHKHRTLWLELLSILIILLLIAAIANLLLDAGIINTDFDLPHTDFFRDDL